MMSAGMILQHAIAIGAALAAGVWLVARARRSKNAVGPCATCAAASHLRTAKRAETSPSRVVILKK